MLDSIASVALTALAISVPAILLLTSSAGRAERRRIAWWIGGWFVAVTSLAAAAVFALGGMGTSGIAVAISAALALALVAVVRSAPMRAVVEGVPLSVLVGIHAGRLLGVFFLLLYAGGRLPPTFALIAGGGDILVALAAIPVAWAAHRRSAGWRPATLWWNAFGLADLVTAIALGVGSAPDSPLRFLFETPGSDAMGRLPWLLIPGYLVPLYVLSHLAIFARLAAAPTAAAADSRRWESTP